MPHFFIHLLLFSSILALAWLVIPHIDLGYFSPDFTYNSWRIFIALCIIPSFTSTFIFAIMPESPKYLMEVSEPVIC